MDQATIDGKALPDLKVTELRDELGKRSLPKNGNKAELVKRLGEYLSTNPEPAARASPVKEKSPDKKSAQEENAVNPIIQQYLVDREKTLAAQLDHKRKVQADHKNEEEAAEDLTTPAKPAAGTSAPVDVEDETAPVSIPRRKTRQPITAPAKSPPPTRRTPVKSPENGSKQTRTLSPEFEAPPVVSPVTREPLTATKVERSKVEAPTATKVEPVRSEKSTVSAPPAGSAAAKAPLPEDLSSKQRDEVAPPSTRDSKIFDEKKVDISGEKEDSKSMVSRDSKGDEVLSKKNEKVASETRVSTETAAVNLVKDTKDEKKTGSTPSTTAATPAAATPTVTRESTADKTPFITAGKTIDTPTTVKDTTTTTVKDSAATSAKDSGDVKKEEKKPVEAPTATTTKKAFVRSGSTKDGEKSAAQDIKPVLAPVVPTTPTVVKTAEESKPVETPAVAGEEKPSAARKLTDSVSIEEEKLDYGEFETDDDVVMKDEASKLTDASSATTSRKRRQPLTASVSEKTNAQPEKTSTVSNGKAAKGETSVADDSKDTKEPPRKMARSALSSVSEENKAGSSEGRGSPPPSKNPVSRMVHIRNLVRPYTANALKELLRKTGTILEDPEHFWTDSIKSQCIVTYLTEDEAVATRKALYDFTWPTSNSKKLTVDFIKEDEFKDKTSLASGPSALRQISSESKRPQSTSRPHIDRGQVEKLKITVASNKETGEAQRDVALARDLEKRIERREKEREKDLAAEKNVVKEEAVAEKPVVVKREDAATEKAGAEREWDRGKDKEPADKKDVKEETPTKTAETNKLELLFNRTEARPQLYWKPLTDEEIKEREEGGGKGKPEEERSRRDSDVKPRTTDRGLVNSSDRRYTSRRDSPPPRRSHSRDRDTHRSAGRAGGSSYRRPSLRRRSPIRRRSRSPPRYRSGGRRSRTPDRRARRW